MATRIRGLDGYHGYQNVSEFVRDATREQLNTLEVKASAVESADEFGADIDIDDLVVGVQTNGGVDTESIEHRLNAIESLLQDVQADRSEGMVKRIDRLEQTIQQAHEAIERIEQEVQG